MKPMDPTLMDIFSYDNIPNDMRITLSFQEILIKATYHNNYELVKKLISMDEFDKSMLEDIGLFCKPFPLYYITMCYKRVMWSDFRQDTMPFVETQRISIDKLQALWQEVFGINTFTGRIWQVQYTINDSHNRMKTSLNVSDLTVDDGNAYTGRFELYPTQNIYNFILLDTYTGRTWQTQWSTNYSDRGIIEIK